MDIKEAPNLIDECSDSDDESVKSEQSVQKNPGNMLSKYIAEYMKMDDELCEIRAVVRDKNKRKKVLHEQLIGIYQQKELDHVRLKSGVQLNMNEKKTTQALGKGVIETLLSKFLGSEEKAKQATEYIYENRSVKFTPVLKRQNN